MVKYLRKTEFQKKNVSKKNCWDLKVLFTDKFINALRKLECQPKHLEGEADYI